MLKLPSGDYFNPDHVTRVLVDEIDGTDGARHARVKLVWTNGDGDIFRNNDALFIKDYLDETQGGKRFLMHELDYATQVLTLGLALKQLEELTEGNYEEIAKNFIALVSERVKDLTPKQILAIRKSYEDNIGLTLDAVIGFMNL